MGSHRHNVSFDMNDAKQYKTDMFLNKIKKLHGPFLSSLVVGFLEKNGVYNVDLLDKGEAWKIAKEVVDSTESVQSNAVCNFIALLSAEERMSLITSMVGDWLDSKGIHIPENMEASDASFIYMLYKSERMGMFQLKNAGIEEFSIQNALKEKSEKEQDDIPEPVKVKSAETKIEADAALNKRAVDDLNEDNVSDDDEEDKDEPTVNQSLLGQLNAFMG